MKTNVFKVVFLFINVIFSFASFSQQTFLGIEYGFGNCILRSNYNKEVLLKGNPTFFMRGGIVLKHNPINSILNYKTGIFYDRRNKKEIQFNYVRMPLGIDVNIGEDSEISWGGGIYGSYLFVSRKLDSYPDYYKTRKKFQTGVYFNIGGAFTKPEKTYKICLYLQANYDITQMFKKPEKYPLGTFFTATIRGFDYFLKIEISRKIGK